MNDKEFEIRLKCIDYELEKSKDIHTSIFSVLVGVLMFILATKTLLDAFNKSISGAIIKIFNEVVKINEWLGIAVLLITPFLVGFLCASIFSWFCNIYLKTREEIYDKSINKLNSLNKECKANSQSQKRTVKNK